jgi:hypothetical protein
MTVCEIYQNKTGFYKVVTKTVVMLGSWLFLADPTGEDGPVKVQWLIGWSEALSTPLAQLAGILS